MAKASFKMPDEFLLRLSRLGEKTDEIIPKVLEAGAGVVEEKVFAGSTKAVRCVTFALDDVTMVNVQAGTATVAAVIGK